MLGDLAGRRTGERIQILRERKGGAGWAGRHVCLVAQRASSAAPGCRRARRCWSSWPVSDYHAPLSALRERAENLAAWLAVWEARKEPDAHARCCASDAIGAIDAAVGELYRVRAQLVAEIRQVDDATVARPDELLRGERGVR
jgi:hypothetical protein